MATSTIEKHGVVVYTFNQVTMPAHTQVSIGMLPVEYRNAKFYQVRFLSEGGRFVGDVEANCQAWGINYDSVERTVDVQVGCFY